MPRILPMFPLGTVLFPHMVLPLHIFEPRYQALAHDVMAGDREFGVTLISRGHEVGGEDQRYDLGTVARVLQAEELEDGRWLVVAVGTRRLRVQRWLEPEPYPCAEVLELAELVPDDVTDLRDVAERKLRRLLALQSELETPTVPPDIPLPDDPTVASFQMAAAGAFTPLDAQSLLAAEDAQERLTLLDTLLTDATEVLRLRLAR